MINSSILNDIKQMLDVEPNDNSFDMPLKIFINSAFGVLREVGCGSQTDPFEINSIQETWDNFLGDDDKMIAMAKEFIYMDVRLKFDPPASSYVADVFKRIRDEDLWRINHEYEIRAAVEV